MIPVSASSCPTSFVPDLEENFNHALKLLDDREYDQAIAILREGAALGHANSMGLLGECYYLGDIVAQDKPTGIQLLQQAGNKGCLNALSRLAKCYFSGEGVAKDEVLARKLFQKVADGGNTYALCKLGYCYAHGTGGPIDPRHAGRLFQLAKDLGNAWGDNLHTLLIEDRLFAL